MHRDAHESTAKLITCAFLTLLLIAGPAGARHTRISWRRPQGGCAAAGPEQLRVHAHEERRARAGGRACEQWRLGLR